MKPTYKQISVPRPHCPDCGTQLSGNNSIDIPWQCKCGTWKPIPKYGWDGEFEIKK